VTPRRLLAAGALLSATGVVVSATAHQTIGGFVVVAGWALALYGIHAFGRRGSLEPEST